MSFSDSVQIIFAGLGAVGVSGAAIAGLAKFFGENIAKKLLAGDRARHEKELEGLKAKYNKELSVYHTQLELIQASLGRYNESQFYLYSELWGRLCDLKLAGDRLWEKLEYQQLEDFKLELKKAKEYVLKGAILIEVEHYAQLTALLEEFDNFCQGKTQLGEFRRTNPRLNRYSLALGESMVIDSNKSIKENYDSLLQLILESFQKRIKGDFSAKG